MYSDDTSRFVNDDDEPEIGQHFVNSLAHLREWFTDNCLSMIMHRNQIRKYAVRTTEPATFFGFPQKTIYPFSSSSFI